MKLKDLLLLVLLSAIWGGSFILMRILSPAIGPVGTAFSRLFIAGLFFIVYYLITGQPLHFKRDWKIIALIGVINSAIPFLLFAIAALHIPAALSSIINSMSPMFGLIFAVLLLNDRLTVRRVSGVALGIVGVVIISGSKSLATTTAGYLALLACLLAATCYGLGSTLVKKYAAHIEPVVMAGLSQFFASLSLLPFAIFQRVDYQINGKVIVALLILAIICSGLAYLIYYSLVRRIGPTKTLTVTFLIPIFGMLWGFLILAEAIAKVMIYGMLFVLFGTFLVLYQPPKNSKGSQ